MPEYFLCCKATGEEITLGTTGEHVIGRGPLLKVVDKRVSRNHAVLKIANDGITLYPKHSNPCFYKAVNGNEFIPLPKDTSQQLSQDDTISLLPNEHVYTIKIVKNKDNDEEEIARKTPAKDQDKSDTVEANIIEPTVTPASSSDKDAPKEKPLLIPHKDNRSPPPTSHRSPPPASHRSPPASDTGGSTGRTRKLPAWLLGSSVPSSEPAAPAKKKAPAPRKKPSTDAKPQVQRPPVKKRKVSVSESEEEKADTPPATAQTDSTGIESKDDADKNGKETAKNKLPSCPYGKQCYRKNPLHFKEYSHSDEEEDDSEKPECPYGTSCYRKNPAHFKEYKHTQPPAAATGEKRARPNTRPKREKKKKKTVLSGDSDDDGQPNTYDYNDSFIDDEDIGSSSTSYGPDSDDEDWEPINDSEDVNELVQDADSFIANKKMHRTS